MADFIRSDLDFILEQIKIAEAHSDAIANGADPRTSLLNLIGGSPNLSFGLRTVDGSYNNLLPGQDDFGQADQPFPHLSDPEFRDIDNPELPPMWDAMGGTDYGQPGNIVDANPRIISNLLVDMTSNNPAATAAYEDHIEFGATATPVFEDDGTTPVLANDGSQLLLYHIPNVAPDAGLSAPFNSWMTLFGQFFDHGLDLVNKGGNGTVFVPLMPDDPLYDDTPGAPNFMVLTRANVDAGEPVNATTPFVDQNQTYTSNPSHQVFLREYVLDSQGRPVATGELIKGADGGMATWADVKAQALNILGISLDNHDAASVPKVLVDLYGNFIPGANGFPQLVDAVTGAPVEGSIAVPADATLAQRSGHAFLLDINHDANPFDDQGVAKAEGTYDAALLDRHYIAGDGRANENFGLTAVHHIFHSEHNRLAEQTKDIVLASNDLAFLNEWLRVDVAALPASQAEIDALQWDGERIFQAARFGTEMQYQHLVFEDFARKIQPQIDIFIAPVGYDVTIDPAIVSEFAHTVYRFGHSMLTESVDRYSADFKADNVGLIEAFLNPDGFETFVDPVTHVAQTLSPDEAAGAVIRGMTRQVGNEIDEFVTDALRNNLLGLPLDLATINMVRGRDTGVPSLNNARKDFYAQTGDSQLTPYSSWFDFAMNLKNQTSIVNFIAAYGTHAALLAADVDTAVEKRAVAMALVMGGSAVINQGTASERTFTADDEDRLAFLNSEGAYANAGTDSVTGLDAVDLWIGGLAEAIMPFGGMLGSTFNFVFETQLEALQNGDRFYYLARTAGMNFINELEQNSFTTVLINNSDARHLPIDAFSTPKYILEVDRLDAAHDGTPQFNAGLGSADPTDPTSPLVPLVIRNNPATPGADTNYLRYTGEDHVVLGGSAQNDILIASEGDDTVWGDGGNDRIEGGHGNDNIDGGAGDDIITDTGGDDVIKGQAGNDVIHGGPGLNLIISGSGSDFIITGEDVSEVFAGQGNDFIYGSTANEGMQGNEGNDWIEVGTQDGAPGDNFDPFGRDQIDGHDVFIGNGGFDEFVAEGGDDIMVGSPGQNRNEGMSGYDWVTYKTLPSVYADLNLPAFDETPIPPSPDTATDRYANVEGLSGTSGNDRLFGSDVTAADMPLEGARGSVLNAAGIARIAGLQEVLGAGVTSYDGGNIILGGDGSDIITGRGGDDIIDGDKWLNVRIAVAGRPALNNITSMTQIQAEMLAGTINPSQLSIVREILTANGAGDIDTAVFSGNLANYTVEFLGGKVVRVTDNVGTDGVDMLYRIERLQFADQVVINNDAPIGEPTISDTSPTEGQLLTANRGNVEDPDGTTTSVFTFRWQALVAGVWTNITGATGASFTPTQAQVNQQIRVVTTFTDDSGNVEQVASAPTVVVGDLFTSGAGTQTFNGTEGDDNANTGAGADVLNGNGGADILNGAAGADTINGGAGNDTLIGGEGNDTMNGGAGADAMSGGIGNDTYTVDDAGDAVAELANEGTDQVNTSLNSYTLTANVENLTFAGGTGDFVGTGNDLANRIQGNGGNDTLDGLAGIDTMVGGAGDDTYVQDNAADVTTEAAAAGTDTVISSVTDTLMANVENVTLASGNANIGFTGNGLNNVMTGNDGNNALGGAGGDDHLSGGLGQDNLLGGAGADFLEGGEGNDSLVGEGGNDTMDGGAGNDSLSGDAGNDVFIGGAGNDTLAGGAGNDVFVFADGFGADQVTTFDSNPAGGGQDMLDISAMGISAVTFDAGVIIAQSGANTVVTINGTDTITLVGVASGTVTQADFVLA